MTYTVEVTREGDVWIADVTNLAGAHTHARTLEVLADRVQEVIGLVLDAPEGERFDIDYSYAGVDDQFLEATRIGQARVDLDRRERELSQQAASAASALSSAGWSVRDISGALRMSPGRVSQILPKRRVG